MKKIFLIAILCGWLIPTQAQVTITMDTTGGACFGNTNLIANVAGPMGTQSYTFQPIPHVPESFGGNPVFLFDDDVTPALPIGFTFCFLGNAYTQFYIGSNGWISFSPGQSTAYTSAPIPNVAPNVPKNAIMGPWEDWNPGIGGTITYQTLGTAPNRRLVVTWNTVPMFQCITTYGTFQIVCHEDNSLIENHLINKPNCPGWANGTGTQGIHNDAGTVAFVDPARNSQQWVTNNESTAFVPDGIVWSQGGTIIGIGDTLSLPPGSSGWYTATVTLCDGTTQSDSFNVTSGGTSASLDFADANCFGESSGSAWIDIAGGNPADYTYQWDDPMAQTNDTATNLAAGTYNLTITGVLNGCTATYSVTVGEPTDITGTTVSYVACDNGSTGAISVDAQGGTGPYTYSIDNGVNFQPSDSFPNLPPGSYDIIVMDSLGCQDTIQSGVPLIPLPQIDSVVTTDPSCISSDGTITIYVSGGGTYTYSIDGGATWSGSNTFSNLGVGTYNITVSDIYGCASFSTVDLVNPAAPVIDNAAVVDPACGVNDGSITLTVSGANPPFQYSFDGGVNFGASNAATNLGSGVYNIVVVDALGCQATTTVTLADNAAPTITSISITQPVCEGDSGIVTIHTSGGALPLEYSLDGGATWQNDSSFSSLAPGNYTFTVNSANNCSVDSTITINAPAPLSASFTASPPNGVDPLDVLFTNTSVGATSYEWWFGDGDSTSVSDPNHIYSPKGQYIVTLVASNGLCTDTATMLIDVYGESSLFIPNVFSPNGDGYNDTWAPIVNGVTAIDVQIFNIWGNLVYSWNTLGGFWDGGNSPAGTYYYIVTTTSADGTVRTETGSFTLLF